MKILARTMLYIIYKKTEPTQRNFIMTTANTYTAPRASDVMAQMAMSPLLTPYEYNRDLETELSQKPQVFILMLLQRSVEKALTAKECHEAGELVAKGFHIGRLTSLVDALRDRLVFQDQSIIAYNFADLYEYIDACLQQAVTEAGTEYLDSAVMILNELKQAWEDAMHLTGNWTTTVQ
jgi:flagellar protein FliS